MGGSRIAVCGLVLAVAPLTGCGGGGADVTTTSARPQAETTVSSVQKGYLARAANGVLFIQWTRTDDAVTGTLSMVYANLDDRTEAESASHSFSGIVSGDSVTLTLDSGSNWNGTLDGLGLTLSYTADDGFLQSFNFRSATVDDYNAAVAEVQAGVGEARAETERAKAEAELKRKIDSDVVGVWRDLDNLAQDTASAQSVLEDIPAELERQRNDVATTKAGLAKTLRLAGYERCTQAYSTQSDAYAVESDLYSVQSFGYSVDTHLRAAVDALDSLRLRFAALTKRRAALPSYQPSDAPTSEVVSSAIAAAERIIKQSRNQMAEYLDDAEAMLAAAKKYAAQAEAACDG